MDASSGAGGPPCSVCSAVPSGDGARFCGRCGALLQAGEPVARSTERGDGRDEAPPTAEGASHDEGAASASGNRSARVDRRTLLTGVAGLVVGGLVGAGLADRRTGPEGDAAAPATDGASSDLEPPRDGAPPEDGDLDATGEIREVDLPEGSLGSGIEAGHVSDLLDQLREGPVKLTGNGVAAVVVRWDPSISNEQGMARDRYGSGAEGHPILDRETGLLALSLRAPGSGCEAQYCETSGWFEDPCQGSRWNGWGELREGPAARGMDRFPSRVRNDGVLVIDVARYLNGPPEGDVWLQTPPRGPHCLD